MPCCLVVRPYASLRAPGCRLDVSLQWLASCHDVRAGERERERESERLSVCVCLCVCACAYVLWLGWLGHQLLTVFCPVLVFGHAVMACYVSLRVL